MLLTQIRTAGLLAVALSMAVFFSSETKAKERGALGSLDSSMNQLIYLVSPSVVTIEGADSVSRDPRCGRSSYHVVSSGVVFDALGNIITSASAVAGKTNLMVTYSDGSLSAKVVGIDYQSGLALIKAERPVGQPVYISDAYTCVGQLVLMMGNAYGLRASPSLGFCAGARPGGTLQFQAMMTSGSIGGGLFDLNGNLVAVVVGGMAQPNQPVVGLGVPAYKLKELVNYLVRNGDRQAGYIGISASEIEIMPPIQIPSNPRFDGDQVNRDIDRGVLVTEVVSGSPAARSGIRLGDLLYSLDGEQIFSAVDLMNTIRTIPPGVNIEFQVVRHNLVMTISVPVGESGLYSMMLPGQLPKAQPNPAVNSDSLLLEIQKLKSTISGIERTLLNGKR